MSGFEVVGVVLGALPLVIAGISSYRAGKTDLAVWRKYGHLLKDLTRELQSQEIFFQNNIEILLKTAGVDELDVAAFIQAGESRGKWTSSMEDDVKDYLRKPSFDAFCSTLDGYQAVIGKIAARMQQSPEDFLPAGKSFEDVLIEKKHPDGTFEIKKRLKFVVSKKEIEIMLQQLQTWNSNLSKICSDASKINQLDALVPSRRAAKVATKLYRVRGQASRLFRAISSGWSTCHPCHEASVRLESRLDEHHTKPGKQEMMRLSRFRLGLSESPAEPGKYALWHEAEVPNHDDDDHHEEPQIAKSTVIVVLPDRGQVSKAQMQELKDICAAISKANSKGHTVTLSVGRGAKLLLASETPHEVCEKYCCRSEAVSLADLLQSKKNPTNPYRRLSLAERTTLSIVLASSILQLWGTPWLNRPCMKSSVLFPPPNQKGINTKHPFISVPHKTGSQEPQWCSLRVCLLELGITLLELWHNTTMETHYGYPRWESSAITADFYERLTLALKWLDDTNDDMVPRHSRAVRTCIKFCHSSVSDKEGLGDAGLRNEIYEGIIKPLLENAKDGGV